MYLSHIKVDIDNKPKEEGLTIEHTDFKSHDSCTIQYYSLHIITVNRFNPSIATQRDIGEGVEKW